MQCENPEKKPREVFTLVVVTYAMPYCHICGGEDAFRVSQRESNRQKSKCRHCGWESDWEYPTGRDPNTGEPVYLVRDAIRVGINPYDE